MNYKEAEQIFMEKEGNAVFTECLKEFDDYFIRNQEEIGNGFMESLRKTAVRLRELPFQPKYCVYTIYRTDLLENHQRYCVNAFDDKWYYGQMADHLLSYEAGWGFQFFHQMWERLKLESKRYAGKVDKAFVDNFAMANMMEFSNRMAQLLEIGEFAERVEKTGEFKDICPDLCLYMGEHMGMVCHLLN